MKHGVSCFATRGGYLTAAVACLHNSLAGLLEEVLCVAALTSRRGLACLPLTILMLGHMQVQR